ncbi:Proteasome activator complex subunit 3 [Leucoagaricus sp. SymC.cos]|nr:Proteasome activator complex subunit 3 [Leucoagaricus sp. SymC.cos]
MEKMDKDLSNKVEDFRKKVTQASEEIVFRSFPNKILELTDLIETTRNPDSPFHSSNVTHSTDTTVYPPASEASPVEAPQSKKRKLENGATNYDTIVQGNVQSSPFTGRVLSNKHLVEKVHGVVKKEAEELAAFVDKVKLWVTLTLPKIEDGDNFGVQIQEEVLGELHRAQESAYSIRDSTRQDYLTRAKLCSKLIKYPNVEDYKLAVIEHDDRQLYLARQHLHDLRNVYAVIMDLMHKNISKIRAPKANNSVGLY